MEEKYYIIEEAGWKATVFPEFGGAVLSLSYRGKPVLRPVSDIGELKENPFFSGMPVLFPANRTFDGSFLFAGKRYSLPVNEKARNANLHGCVYKQCFQVLESRKNGIVLRYVNKGESYPFPFSLTVTYRLSGRGAEAFYEISNDGTAGMPFTFGLHTTFIEPEYFAVPLLSEQERDGNLRVTGRYIPLSEQARSYANGTSPKGKIITGFFRSGGNTALIGPHIRFEVSREFDHWILYNQKGEGGFLCVEPQCGAVNGLNLENGCRVLDAGKSCTLSVKLTYEP